MRDQATADDAESQMERIEHSGKDDPDNRHNEECYNFRHGDAHCRVTPAPLNTSHYCGPEIFRSPRTIGVMPWEISNKLLATVELHTTSKYYVDTLEAMLDYLLPLFFTT